MATQEKVDVVIVGAGPSGAVFADVLARAGKKVVILEFGPDWDMKEFVSSEIWAKRLKHAPRFELGGRNPPGHGGERRLGHRRRDAALLRQLAAAASERFQGEERARPRARLADLL